MIWVSGKSSCLASLGFWVQSLGPSQHFQGKIGGRDRTQSPHLASQHHAVCMKVETRSFLNKLQREKWLHNVALWSPHICHGTCATIFTHTHHTNIPHATIIIKKMNALKPYMQLCIWYPFRMGSGMPPQSRVSRTCSLASCVLSMASEPLGVRLGDRIRGGYWSLCLPLVWSWIFASGLLYGKCLHHKFLLLGTPPCLPGQERLCSLKPWANGLERWWLSSWECILCLQRSQVCFPGPTHEDLTPSSVYMGPLRSACECSQPHTDSKHLHNSVFLILKNVSRAVSPPLGCVC